MSEIYAFMRNIETDVMSNDNPENYDWFYDWMFA